MAKSNKKYTIEEKEKLIKRMLPPESYSTSKLSAETDIPISTLSTWKVKALKGDPNRMCGRPKNTLSSREKFMIVMETYTISEIELSKYCREHGLYVNDVKRWRTGCIEANETKKVNNATRIVNTNELKLELSEEKKKSKELAKEIRIKDKALAETTALLVLRKKLNAIFGENEEDQ